ncbi:hypothetical protein D3C81_1248360 [compost metagenome]
MLVHLAHDLGKRADLHRAGTAQAPGGGHGHVEVVGAIEQNHLRRLIVRGRPERAVVGSQITAQRENLGVLVGGDSLRIDLYTERQ